MSPPTAITHASTPLFAIPRQDDSMSCWFMQEVQPHEPALRSYLRRKFPSLTDVDDIIQDTYRKIYQARLAGKVSYARPYLFTIARNTACDLIRRHKIISITNIAEPECLAVVDDKPSVHEALSNEQEIAILSEAIAALPDRCRQVLTLCKLYGLSHRQIARDLGISENTVNAQVALGVLRCRNFLRARGLLKERAHG